MTLTISALSVDILVAETQTIRFVVLIDCVSQCVYGTVDFFFTSSNNFFPSIMDHHFILPVHHCSDSQGSKIPKFMPVR